jgi:Protein of unknown function (DUF3037)
VLARCSFSYAVVRVVPHVEREEFLNSGVIVFCGAIDYLAARIELDETRLLAMAPDADPALVRRHLEAIPRICAGEPRGGPIGRLPLRERWRWLVAPRSTILQTSPAHAGLCEKPDEELGRLFERVVQAGAGGDPAGARPPPSVQR